MSILVIGGDYLGNITQKLSGMGFDKIEHNPGRNRRSLIIPQKTDVVLVLIDYINHDLAWKVKEQTREKGIRTVFARRAWSHIHSTLIKDV
ncbi:MAG: hypothetical protein APF84_08490 [Gracilibacter sp. BRH_c7a]|nr:MAG: hypothetical protein APF84_08490 [Gracilibacter sp. BRH_c7a]